MSRQHTNAARTRARRKVALGAINAAAGGWVDVSSLCATDLLALRRDPAIEMEQRLTESGHYVTQARRSEAHAAEFARLQRAMQDAWRKSGTSPKAHAEFLEACKALSDFDQPRRVG